MQTKGEIILIDKDEFENAFLKEIVRMLNLATEVKHFQTPEGGLDYIKNTTKKIFVIISVIDFGTSDKKGLTMKKQINDDPELLGKAIPFVFMTYLDDKETVNEAYKLNIQGYFRKPVTLEASAKLLSSIFSYWSDNLRPDDDIFM